MDATIRITRQVETGKVAIPEDLSKYKGHASGRISTFVAGANAAANGIRREACPYSDGQGSASWRKTWLRGYDAWKARKDN